MLTSDPGIGAAIVRNLASKGCNIIINYATQSSDEPAAKLAAEMEATHGVRAVPVRADISKTAECDRIIEVARKHFTRPETGGPQVDILIHNAAVLYLGPLEAVVEAEFQHIYAVNVLAPRSSPPPASPTCPRTGPAASS